MTPPVISVEHLTKQYDLGVIGTGTLSRDLNRWWARLRKQPDPYTRIGQPDAFARIGESILALDDVSFKVNQGEALGIIGRNGAGKSTLLKILSRVTAPSSGVVKIKGRIGSLLEVGTGFHPELTGRENVYLNGAILGMKKAEVTRKFDEIVSFAGVEKFIDTPVKRYSSGMYVRLAFAVAAHLDPEILIVDEVLAVGDAEFQKKCLGKMGDVAGEGRTVLFVSHNMEAIERLCNKCILLRDGALARYDNSKDVVSEYLTGFESTKIESANTRKPNVLHDQLAGEQKLSVNYLEILDSNFAEKILVRTWDDIVLKIGFFSDKMVENGSVELNVFDKYGNKIILLSTKPDSTIDLNFKQGQNWIYCRLNQLPLAAGHYAVGCGLAIPNQEYLWQDNTIGSLVILPKDVYSSGLAPISTRSLLAIQHEWITEDFVNGRN